MTCSFGDAVASCTEGSEEFLLDLAVAVVVCGLEADTAPAGAVACLAAGMEPVDLNFGGGGDLDGSETGFQQEKDAYNVPQMGKKSKKHLQRYRGNGWSDIALNVERIPDFAYDCAIW